MAAAADTLIRPARPGDEEAIFALIRELAEYERLQGEVRGSAALLRRALFEEGGAEALVVEVGGEAVGYAIFYATFSTFECRPGIWLEDVYVRPEHRRSGLGRQVLERLAALVGERGGTRLEWCALDWNRPALEFYDGLGAQRLEEWVMLRLDGEALDGLAG